MLGIGDAHAPGTTLGPCPSGLSLAAGVRGAEPGGRSGSSVLSGSPGVWAACAAACSWVRGPGVVSLGSGGCFSHHGPLAGGCRHRWSGEGTGPSWTPLLSPQPQLPGPQPASCLPAPLCPQIPSPLTLSPPWRAPLTGLLSPLVWPSRAFHDPLPWGTCVSCGPLAFSDDLEASAGFSSLYLFHVDSWQLFWPRKDIKKTNTLSSIVPSH